MLTWEDHQRNNFAINVLSLMVNDVLSCAFLSNGIDFDP